MTLQEFNQLSTEEVQHHLKNCCGSEKWVHRMSLCHPYGNGQSLLQAGQSIWYRECTEADWLEAFSNHPRIGEKKTVSDKVAASIHLAVGEQSGVEENDEKLLLKLHAENIEYEAKFGFIFIVFASGKRGEEMLELLEHRLNNSLEDELHIAMGEQWKITTLRLKNLLRGEEFSILQSPITTHILDTSIGKPANGVSVALFKQVGSNWQKIAIGKTNADGRVIELLPAGMSISADTYKLLFDTGTYFEAKGQTSFYPEVQIIFRVTNESHYHVPLLLNPFGYSTYRGS